MLEKMFISPCAYNCLQDAVAIQTAVDEACRRDVRTVVIPEKAGGWDLNCPVSLPDNVMVILQGATIRAKTEAFVNANARLPYALATEQTGITLMGTNGATIVGDQEPQIRLSNVMHYQISGIRLEGGAGIALLHARKGSVQQLRFENSRYGVVLGEGCRENILRDIFADTQQETVLFSGGSTTVWGRSPEICQSTVCRICAKTEGAPAVAIRQGAVAVSSLLLRDITDKTPGEQTAIYLGDGEGELRDVSVRNLASTRVSVAVSAACDGIWMSGLQGAAPVVSPEATRVLVDSTAQMPQEPIVAENTDISFISANDPAYFGATDADTLQNAIDAAKEKGACLVIPRYNARTDALCWNLEKTLRLHTDSRIILIDAHLRLNDYTYCNLFAAADCENIAITGVGTACLDSGIPNGLKEKNAGKFGFGPITDNALLRFENVAGFKLSGFSIHQSRWYGVSCTRCTQGCISDIDFYAPPIFPDLGGIHLQSGCRELLIENLTGITGEDMVLLTAQTSDISDIHIRDLNANVGRCRMVAMCSQSGAGILRVVVEGIMDSSLPEQKKQPRAMVRIGQAEGCGQGPGKLEDVIARDIYGRSAATVELGGCSQDVLLENIHSFGNTGCGVQCAPNAETVEFILSGTSATLATQNQKEMIKLKNLHINGLFFRCQQASSYMRGTATSIITDRKKFVGTVAKFGCLETEELLAENVLAERVGEGIVVTGKATVHIRNLQIAECGRKEAKCGPDCTLTVNGETVPVTPTTSL